MMNDFLTELRDARPDKSQFLDSVSLNRSDDAGGFA